MYKEVEGKLNVLDSSKILETLVQNNVIEADPSKMTMVALFGVYRTGLVNYSGTCENESFGEDGKYTNLICKMDEIRRDILSTDEELPVSKSYPLLPFQAAKPSMLADTDITARTYCEQYYPYSAKNCPEEVLSQIKPNIVELQNLIASSVPGGYDNPLLSYGIGRSEYNNIEAASNFLWGDGLFKMLEIVLDKDDFAFECKERICLMEASVLVFTISGYIFENTEINVQEDLVYSILTGYLYHRHSKKIHEKRSDRAVMSQVFKARHKCYYFTGVLIQELCGLGIAETLVVIKKLDFFNKCPIKTKMMKKVNRLIRKGAQYKNSLTVKKCVRKLKRNL